MNSLKLFAIAFFCLVAMPNVIVAAKQEAHKIHTKSTVFDLLKWEKEVQDTLNTNRKLLEDAQYKLTQGKNLQAWKMVLKFREIAKKSGALYPDVDNRFREAFKGLPVVEQYMRIYTEGMNKRETYTLLDKDRKNIIAVFNKYEELFDKAEKILRGEGDSKSWKQETRSSMVLSILSAFTKDVKQNRATYTYSLAGEHSPADFRKEFETLDIVKKYYRLFRSYLKMAHPPNIE